MKFTNTLTMKGYFRWCVHGQNWTVRWQFLFHDNTTLCPQKNYNPRQCKIVSNLNAS